MIFEPEAQWENAPDDAFLYNDLDTGANLVLAAPVMPERPGRVQPVVAINIRLKQMRELAKRRMRQKARIDDEAWLAIYAEGLAHRYAGHCLKSVLIRDLKGLKGAIDVTDEEIADAAEAANRAFECEPTKSAWSTRRIGRALGVTLKEREDETHASWLLRGNGRGAHRAKEGGQARAQRRKEPS